MARVRGEDGVAEAERDGVGRESREEGVGDGGGGAAEVDDELGDFALDVAEVGLQLRADLGDEG